MWQVLSNYIIKHKIPAFHLNSFTKPRSEKTSCCLFQDPLGPNDQGMAATKNALHPVKTSSGLFPPACSPSLFPCAHPLPFPSCATRRTDRSWPISVRPPTPFSRRFLFIRTRNAHDAKIPGDSLGVKYACFAGAAAYAAVTVLWDRISTLPTGRCPLGIAHRTLPTVRWAPGVGHCFVLCDAMVRKMKGVFYCGSVSDAV